MTFENLEKELPNGLHDAQIRSITRNFENGTLTLETRILVGMRDDPPEKRSQYRNGSITFTGVELFVIEPPEASSAFPTLGPVWFAVSRSEDGLFPPEVTQKLSEEVGIFSLFILDWHSHIHVSASDMQFAWDC